MKTKLVAVLLCLLIFFSLGTQAFADSYSYTAVEVENFVGGIVSYKNGSASAQSFIDGSLTDNAGTTSEFYVIALSQISSYDFSRYESALLSYLNSTEVYSATSREKYALALASVGSTNSYIADTANEAIGGQGLMSLVFGLHLLNNGYTSSLYSRESLVSEILSYQLSDGGWAVIGSNSDVDVTAMTLQALAPNIAQSGVSSAVDRALTLLSSRQLDSGGFKSMGVENCESSAQVLTALSALGINAQTDSRFVKNGNSPLSAMLSYRSSDGSFGHTDAGFNETATTQAMYALVSYIRYLNGESALYILDGVRHSTKTDNSAQNSNSDTANADADTSSQTVNGSQNTTQNGSVKTSQNSSTASTESEIVNPTEVATSALLTATESPSYGGFQLSATADIATADEVGGSPSYKLYVICGIVLLSVGAWLVLFLRGKRGKKHLIAIALVALVAVVLVLVTNVSSKDSYAEVDSATTDKTVTLSIRCDTILDMQKVNDRIPDDGVILATTTMGISDGDTVYDVLLRCAKIRSIQLDNRGSATSAYIAGINYLYEFDYGDLSGWMYRVNGEFPDVGCQSYYLSAGDVVEWLYTTNIGKDL